MANSIDLLTWSVDAIEETFDDIEKIADFIAESAGSQRYGKRFSDTANVVLNSLKTWPRAHRHYSDDFDDDIRRIEIPGYRAAILYKVYDDTLEVIAVMAFHTLKDPDEYNRIVAERVAIADNKMKSNIK
jgi:plasmid stabilization system protein ParE